MASELEGKRVLVTGGSSGLGAHFARVAAREGASVAIAARRRERLEALAGELEASGAPAAVALDLDVTDNASIEACVEAAFDGLGGLDVLVNNAGIAGDGMALDQTADEFNAVIDTNLRGVWFMARTAARAWVDRQATGAVINIASILGVRVARGLSAYAMSKAGVVHMTKALAIEWASHGIRVNALAPGYFSTEINDTYLASEAGERLKKRVPMCRFGELEELTGPFLLLAGDGSSYMTGSIIAVDGGHLNNPL